MSEPIPWRLVLALEGVVTDPADGLISSLRWALAEVGQAAPTESDLSWVLDAELDEAIGRLLGPHHAGRAAAVIERFRQRYDARGRFEARVDARMARTLEGLARRPDVETVAVSAWPRDELDRQLAALRLARAFDAVACPQRRACARCRRALAARVARTEAGARQQSLWVSDDPDDIAAAHAHGVTSVAALWGRSGAEELAPAAPTLWAETPGELASMLTVPQGPLSHLPMH